MKPRRSKAVTAKPIAIAPWPTSATRTPAEVADEAVFVGSPEHKDYTNPVIDEPPQPRAESDGSRCPTYSKERWCEMTQALRDAIRAECTGSHFDPLNGGGTEKVNWWPRYVFGYFEGKLFQARHRTDSSGNRYKGWFLSDEERPDDPDGRLAALAARATR